MRVPFFILILMILAAGCDQPQQNRAVSSDELKEPLIKVNKTQVEKEAGLIKAYLKRHKWEVEQTGTGLQYMIYSRKDTLSPTAMEGQWAKVSFKINLLDGTLCYSSEESGPQEFFIGRDDVESGLHEGITYMRVGDKAKLLLPAHLAHGLIGDKEKIPPRSPIIYDIELLGLR